MLAVDPTALPSSLRPSRRPRLAALALAGAVVLGGSITSAASAATQAAPQAATRAATQAAPQTAVQARAEAVAAAAISQIGRTTSYDPAYVRLAYPGGDVPIDRGVCTDVVIRALRAVGIDLQVAVHQDMQAAFSKYPKLGKKAPDANIDHRRVKNLLVFFTRAGAAVPMTQRAADYQPGDIVMWDLGNGLQHTGIVADALVPGTDRHLIVHNIGNGTELEDILFEFRIIGHFRYPAPATTAGATPAA